MEEKFKIICLVSIFLFVGKSLYAQSGEQSIYIGPGFGMDYGGFGAKVEYLPVKHLGVFGGVGYNLLSLGWNVGATFKMLPYKKVSPNLIAFYGYNGVTKTKGASYYNMTSYSVTVGANLDIAISRKGHKISVGLFVPIRTDKFMDNYDAMKADPNIEINNELLPIAISVGFNFRL